MKAPTTREERKIRDADFERRLQPRLLWDSSDGTAIRGTDGYRKKPKVAKKKYKPTEAEDNANGRRLRRRLNKISRGWSPYAKR